MVTTVREAQALTARATDIVERLHRAAQSLDANEEAEERAWLEAAGRRVELALTRTLEGIEQGLELPELAPLRVARADALVGRWIDALQELDAALVTHVGENHPLFEVLFPHRNFDKLRRPSANLDAYRADFERRRASTYVRRLATDPEYPFLDSLFEGVDGAQAAIRDLRDRPAPTEEREEALRADILAHAARLAVALRQARSLADAVLATRPDLASELGFDLKPRRTRSRSAPPESGAG